MISDNVSILFLLFPFIVLGMVIISDHLNAMKDKEIEVLRLKNEEKEKYKNNI